MSNGTAMVTVRRSENANEKIKRFVGLLRRFLLMRIAQQTKKFPMIATTAISM